MRGKGVWLTIFVIVLFSMFNLQTVSAAEYNCTSCSDCSSKIQSGSSGDIIRLNTSITNQPGNCIEFNGMDSITFDCLGNSMSGNGTGYGMWLNSSNGGSDNVTVRDCKIMNFSDGVYLGESSDGNNITSINSSLNSRGVYLYRSADNVFTDIIVQENSFDFYFAATTPAHCSNNLTNITGSGGRPIEYYNYSANIQDKVLSELILCNADSSNVTNVTVMGSDSLNNNLLFLLRTDNANLTDINSSGNNRGVYLLVSSNNTLTNIIANSYEQGIYITSGGSNTIDNMTSDSRYGVRIDSSDNNTIRNSRMVGNSIAGVYLSSSGSDDNLFYNNLLNSSDNFNIAAGAINYWNTTRQSGKRVYSDGTEIGGNFWAYPNGTGYSETCNDTDTDGFCDQTYSLDANNNDYLPLSDKYANIPLDDCSVLDQAGKIYTLTQDIWNSANSTCMNIQENNVTLDCQGYRIDGTDGGSTYGVRINNYDEAKVRNCEISDWAYGIQLSSSTGSKIYNNFITSNTDRGINIISSSTYNNLTNNTVFFNEDYGVVFSSSTNNNFSHGNVSNNTNHGVYFSTADNNRIEYSNMWFNSQRGIDLSSSYGNVFYINNVTSNKDRGIYLASSTGNQIEGGNFKSNGNAGIQFFQSSSNNISDVNVSLNTNDGIRMGSSSNSNRIENVVVSDNTANGISADSSSNNVIIGFDSYSNSNGVSLNYGTGNNFTGGEIYSNDIRGVRIMYSNNNYMIDTTVTSSTNEEIYADDTGSSNNYFINTTFDKSDISISGSTIIWVKWYLQVQVRDLYENPVEEANVSVKDTYGYSWLTGQTNSSGYMPRKTLNEYNQTASGKSFYTNYNIIVNKSDYISNQTYENLTFSKIMIIYIQEIGPPAVQVKTYTIMLVETGVFKPNRMVRTRATVTSGFGKEHVSNATIVIKDDLGVTKINNVNMVNISEVANGYVFEYNYTLPGNAQGLWLINVTAMDIENRRGYDFKKIAVTILNLQVKLFLNDTWDSAKVYIPGEGEKTFAQLGLISPYTDSNPPHYYLASYMNDVLASLVVSSDNPLSISASTGSGNYEMGTDQRFSNYMAFLVFSRGNWRQVENRIGMIEKGEFLSQISPSFSYGLGNKYPLKIVLGYENMDINDTLSVGRGYSRISIENKGITGDKVNIGVERV